MKNDVRLEGQVLQSGRHKTSCCLGKSQRKESLGVVGDLGGILNLLLLFIIYLVGWDLTPLGPFAGPLGSYKPQYCGHILAYCTFPG
jgi:hypothetical protein